MHFQNQICLPSCTEPDSKEQNFDIFLRLKPTPTTDSSDVIRQINDTKVQIISPYYYENERTFQFDRVFSSTTSNQYLFQSCLNSPLANVLSGFNATVLIYGATGAGKTYTMFGNNRQRGVVPMVVGRIFEAIRNSPQTKYQLSLSFYEIYNQTIRDLLQEESSPLNIMEDPTRGTVINQLSEHQLESQQEAMYLLQQGIEHRAMNATKSNQVSSRSHAIFQLSLRQFTSSSRSQKYRITESKLFLIDLAGNQKSFTNCTNLDKRFVEGVNINKSLLTLGKCINILAEKKNHFVPFRDSKLTRILKQSLGGNSKTIMIACVSMQKQSYEETLNTLKYSSLAKNIKNRKVKNVKQVDKCSVSYQIPSVRTCRSAQGNSVDTVNGLVFSVEEKMKTLNILNNLVNAKLKNEQLFEKTKDPSLYQRINQINRFIQEVRKHYEDAIQKAQYFEKLLIESTEGKKTKDHDVRVTQEQYACCLKQIEGLRTQLREKDKRIAQLQKTPSTHMTSIGSQPSTTELQLSKNLSKSSIKINPMQKKSPLEIDVKSSFHLDKENVLGASKVFNKKSKQIVIDLNSRSSKEQFAQDLKAAQRNMKDPNSSKQIQRLISLQQLHQFELNNIEQSMFRKLKFFQQKKVDHQPSSSEARFPLKGLSLGRNK